jgi:hypothetical protein
MYLNGCKKLRYQCFLSTSARTTLQETSQVIRFALLILMLALDLAMVSYFLIKSLHPFKILSHSQVTREALYNPGKAKETSCMV